MTTAALSKPIEIPEPPPVNLDDIELTEGQEQALKDFSAFLMNPSERVFVICGYSGVGKTTLVRVLLNRLEKLLNTINLINPKAKTDWDVQLTATTNKAAEAFQLLTKRTVVTIHSFLGLRVQTDYRTRKTSLVPAKRDDVKHGMLLFIDEASYVDEALLKLIFQQTKDCKIVFMGDPAQLTQVKSTNAPVFEAGYKTALLTQVVRQAEGNPIIEMATAFRHTVNTGEWTTVNVDGHHIQHMPRHDFEQAILKEFSRKDWNFHDSKILAWTNARVVDFNQAVQDHVKGRTEFNEGDYAICNAFVAGTNGRNGVKTDEMVHITSVSDDEEIYGVTGKWYGIDTRGSFFGPNDLAEWKKAYIKLKAEERFGDLNIIDNTWIDLRAAYACTINKSQGSTFNKVFIDLDDVRGCRDTNQVARMLYVGVSRARHQVFLTGDI